MLTSLFLEKRILSLEKQNLMFKQVIMPLYMHLHLRKSF